MKQISNSKVLNYYKQLINCKKLEISSLEKELCFTLYLSTYQIHYKKEFPTNTLNRFNELHIMLSSLYEELMVLQDKYYDIKGKEGSLYV